MADQSRTTGFQHGDVLDYDAEDEVFRVILDSVDDRGRALVSPEDNPNDGFFVKLSDLRKPPHAG